MTKIRTRFAWGLSWLARPAQQGLVGHHLPRVEREHLQQLEFGGSDVDGLSADRHPAPLEVDGEFSDHDGWGPACLRSAVRTRATSSVGEKGLTM